MLYKNSWYHVQFRSKRFKIYLGLATGFCMIAVFPLTYYWTKHLPQLELWQIEIPQECLPFLPFFLVMASFVFTIPGLRVFFLVGKAIFAILDLPLLCSLLSDFRTSGHASKSASKKGYGPRLRFHAPRLNTASESNFVKLDYVGTWANDQDINDIVNITSMLQLVRLCLGGENKRNAACTIFDW
eukprot:g79526.t1